MGRLESRSEFSAMRAAMISIIPSNRRLAVKSATLIRAGEDTSCGLPRDQKTRKLG